MRAKALRGRQVTNAADPVAPRDLLADLVEVMGAEPRERTEVIRQRLRELDPATYEGITAADLSTQLNQAGIEPYKTNGLMTVRLADIHTAITKRNEIDGE